MQTPGRYDTWDIRTGEVLLEDNGGAFPEDYFAEEHETDAHFLITRSDGTVYISRCNPAIHRGWEWRTCSEYLFKSFLSFTGARN